MAKPLRILGIETSCDDTAIGVVRYDRRGFTIESQVTASQALIHRRYGGVVPEVAAREHAITILPTLQSALKKSRAAWGTIDAIAVTAGPGLNTALLIGVETARAIAYALDMPLVRVNHIEGHICSAWASPNANKIRFPAVALIVSGGHTELIRVAGFGQYALLGRTIDDAVGEAFDKTAKVLGLPYPGGPEISKRSERGNPAAFRFPRALIRPASLDFSYAGLKTSVLYAYQDIRRPNRKIVDDICASFQAAAIDPLVVKTAAAIRQCRARTLLLGGGVAANNRLRQALAEMIETEFPTVTFVPPVLPLCTDNGVMIAMAGAFRASQKDFTPWRSLRADPNWELV